MLYHSAAPVNRPAASLMLLLVVGSFAFADENTDEKAQTVGSVQQLVDQTRDSVVMISVEGREGRGAGIGTGFVVSADGLVATNLHVIGEARPIRVRFHDGRQFDVTEVYASDRHLDLAIVRIGASQLKPLELLPEPEVPQGTPVVVIGNPLGLRHSVVNGVVSGHREIDRRRMLQLAMPIEPGNSGGPVLDMQQRVLGVVTMKSAYTANLGFAIQARALKKLLDAPNPVPMSRWKTIGALNKEDWSTLFGAQWKRQAGQILVSGPGDGFGGRSLCLWNHQNFPEEGYEVGVYVKLDDESGAAGLAFDSDNGQRHYGFYPSGGQLRLTRFDGPSVYSWKVLEQIRSEHYRPGGWNHLKVRVTPGKLVCYVNDQLIVERKIPGEATGKAGLVKFRQTEASFKRFQLQKQIDATQLSDNQRQQVKDRLSGIVIDDWTPTTAVETLTADAPASLQVLQEEASELEQQAARLRRLAQDVHVQAVCRELREVFAAEEGKADLIRAALLISKLDNRELDVQGYLDDFADIAEQISSGLPEEADEQKRVAELNRQLFQQRGFHGSRTNYYHAANSYFDRVLDDREGLPITLSILYMELGRRQGLKIEGVGLPGHFIVRHLTGSDSQLIDVFGGGQLLSDDEAKKMVVGMTGAEFRNEYLEPYSQRSIAERMLRNLLNLARQEDDKTAMLRYLEALVTVNPADTAHRGMRAVLRHETGHREAALEDLQWFLDTQPAGLDLNAILQMKAAFEQSGSPRPVNRSATPAPADD